MEKMKKKIKGVSLVVVRLFVLVTILTVLDAILSGFQLSQLEGGATSEQMGSIDDVVKVFSWIWTGVFLVAMISLYVWLYRSTKRCVSMGADNLKYSPAKAVLWMLVPIVNLVMFGSVFQQLYKASKDPKNWSGQANNPQVRKMWIWQINNFLFSQAASHLLSIATTIDNMAFAITLSIISDIVQIILNVQIIRVVKMITSLQSVPFGENTSDNLIEES